jgi:hypothetical protein
MRIVDRKFVDKTYTRLELANTWGSLRRKATRNGASSTYVSTFDYQ